MEERKAFHRAKSIARKMYEELKEQGRDMAWIEGERLAIEGLMEKGRIDLAFDALREVIDDMSSQGETKAGVLWRGEQLRQELESKGMEVIFDLEELDLFALPSKAREAKQLLEAGKIEAAHRKIDEIEEITQSFRP